MLKVLWFVVFLTAQSSGATAQQTPEQEPTEDAVLDDEDEGLVEDGEPTKPALPKPPDGLLPVTELTRLEYTPRDRPKPLLQGNRLLVVSPSGFVDGYDAQSGEFAWKLGLPGEKLFDPVVFEPAELGERSDGSFKVLLSEPSGHVLVIDGPTGAIDREVRLPFELALPPVRGPGDILFLATPSGDILAYDFITREVVFQTATAEVPLALSSIETLLVVSGGDQTLTAIDLPGGTIRWAFRGRAAFHAAAAFGDDGERVYVGDDTGEFYALDARNGKTKFRWSTGASIRNRALVEKRRVYVATFANSLYAFHANSGDEHWRAFLPGRPATAPLRVNQRLVVATFDGILVEINPQRGLVGRQYQAPGELVYPPTFYLARPTSEEMLAVQAAESSEEPELDDVEEEDGVLSLEDELPEVDYVAADEEELLAAGGGPDNGDNGETGDDTLASEEEAAPESSDEETPREPMWFERSRIAVSLRSGEVLLLHHQPPDVKAPADDVTGEGDDGASQSRKRRPTSGSVRF